jgi:hypothetical protein
MFIRKSSGFPPLKAKCRHSEILLLSTADVNRPDPLPDHFFRTEIPALQHG